MIALDKVPTAMLFDMLEEVSSQRGWLQASDAPDAELHNAQVRIDNIKAELDRRMAW